MSAAELSAMSARFKRIGAENYCAADRLFVAERVVALE
jgi:hypothetical protein